MKRIFCSILALLVFSSAFAQVDRPVKHYSLSDKYTAVEDYELPDLLVTESGRQVRNSRQWEKVRREELISIFESEMFGKVPGKPAGLHFSRICPDSLMYGGTAVRSRIRIYLDASETHSFDMLVHLPAKHEGKIPMFVGLNFYPNEECLDPEKSEFSWPYELITREGFGVAMVHHSSIEQDRRNFGAPSSADVRSWYFPEDEWGAISAWAWGIGRMLDWCESSPEIDMDRIAVIGHSRLGKTALWAAAVDERIDLVVSNSSGCCGAALSRRAYGETIGVIYEKFPYWFIPHFYDYAGKENEFPTDQHALLALAAPRPLYVASAAGDHWADPIGEWLSAKEAAAVYELYGLKGLSSDHMIPLDHADDYGTIAYRIREGVHAMWPDDWYDYLKFAKRQFYQ